MIFDFELTGVTPLIMNFRNIPFEDDLKAWIDDPANAKKSKAGDDRTPPWAWQGKLYNDGANVVMPQENIMSCLRDAGQKIPAGRNSNLKKATQASLLISSEFCSFFGSNGAIKYTQVRKLKGEAFSKQAEAATDLGFSLFVKSARPPGKTTSHVRVRPRFDTWSVKSSIEIIDTNAISPEQLLQIFTIASKSIGLGDWRPGVSKAPGPYGRFSVSLKPQKSR